MPVDKAAGTPYRCNTPLSMADSLSMPQEAAAGTPWAALHDAATHAATPRLYSENAFRLLGAPVLASLRDLLRRGDELAMGLELGTATWDWAFAPTTPADLGLVRAAAQALKDPRRRLVDEFFWFWPESYPDDGADAALHALARGEPGEAVALWAARSADEAPTTLHNLAVYHHLMALEQEQAAYGVPDEDKMAWWQASARYWERLLQHEPCWERLRARVRSWQDPQVPPEAVDRLRRLLPEYLSAVNAALALRYAEAGDTSAAGRQVAVLGAIHPEPAAARRALDRGAAPVIRRIDTRISDAKRVAAADAAAAGDAAHALVAHSLADIHTVDTLCGRESEFFVETCTRLATAVLDALVVYQRATQDDAGCLPLLVLLGTLPLFTDTRIRVESTFDVIFANTVSEAGPGGEDPPDDTAETPRYARAYRVLREHLIPRWLQLEMDEATRRAGADQIAALLLETARSACDLREDIAFASHILETRAILPATDAVRERRHAERGEFERRYEEDRSKELRLPLGSSYLEITRRGVVWNGVVTELPAIEALRCGILLPTTGAGAPLRHVVAWLTAEGETVLDEQSAFLEPEVAAEQYARVLDALYYFVVPRVVSRLVEQVQAGEAVRIGNIAISATGLARVVGPRVFKREQQIPFARVRHRLEAGVWIVGRADAPRQEEHYVTAEVWNALLCGYVIDALAST